MKPLLLLFLTLHFTHIVCTFRPRLESLDHHIGGAALRPYLVVDEQPFALDPGDYSNPGTPINFFHKYLTPNCFCRKEIFGNLGDDGYKFACADFITKDNCLALSLGSDNNIEFETSIYQKKGCHSLTFDMKPTTLKMPPYVTFQRATIGTCSNCTRIKDLIPAGGVDLFKIDLEKAEWNFMEEIPAINANQIQIEIHSLNKTTLEKLGRWDTNWCLANIDPNVLCPSCLELLFVNRRLTTLRLK
eukprot:TRINITY_DN620_c0_g1_i3.p1 TRINITY_DN620_c0_g1~~TRINITY_DN620_c0_g1_i3.p1  ORF type:complete len:254 (-),score=38.20 TRINITY_DN620_c0_g1_i3:13-747(-)